MKELLKRLDVIFNDWTIDTYDPVTQDTVTEDEKYYHIDNSFHIYDVLKSDVKELKYYDEWYWEDDDEE